MDDNDFDTALLTFAFRIAAERGWRAVSVAGAARAAGLPLDRARARFRDRTSLLLRFGQHADRLALAAGVSDGPVRDRLFEILMRRIDALQAQRDGVLALFRALPTDPMTAGLLATATLGSMAWMLEAAGIEATGVMGRLRVQGLMVVWLATVRAWTRDNGEDLSATMAALDAALRRADQVQGWVDRRGAAAADAPDAPADGAAEPPDDGADTSPSD